MAGLDRWHQPTAVPDLLPASLCSYSQVLSCSASPLATDCVQCHLPPNSRQVTRILTVMALCFPFSGSLLTNGAVFPWQGKTPPSQTYCPSHLRDEIKFPEIFLAHGTSNMERRYTRGPEFILDPYFSSHLNSFPEHPSLWSIL